MKKFLVALAAAGFVLGGAAAPEAPKAAAAEVGVVLVNTPYGAFYEREAYLSASEAESLYSYSSICERANVAARALGRRAPYCIRS